MIEGVLSRNLNESPNGSRDFGEVEPNDILNVVSVVSEVGRSEVVVGTELMKCADLRFGMKYNFQTP